MSDNIQHTPGPWKVGMTGNSVHAVGNKADGRYGFTLCDLDGIYPEKEANARLIASAPDLLAERDALRSHLDALSLYADSVKDQLAEASSLLREIDEYLSSNAQNNVWSGSKLHQDVKRALLSKLAKLPEGR